MEPASHPCTNPFPFYELHQVTHTTMETPTPSAMDILCEIVNSEYSDIGYTMAPPVVGIPSQYGSASHQPNEKESFLDILYSTGSKAMEIVDNDVEMIHEQHSPYAIHFNSAAATSNSTASHVFSPLDIHHLKLPLLEQEPEASITSSQVEESIKHKEIRRNLERSLLMGQAAGAAAVGPSQLALANNMISSEAGEGKYIEKHEISSCSNPMMLCEGYDYMYTSPRVDKVSSSSVRPYNSTDDDDKSKLMVESHGKLSKRKAASCNGGKLAESGSAKKSAKISGNAARIKHGVAANDHQNNKKPSAIINNAEDIKGVQQETRPGTKRLQLEVTSMTRGGSLMTKDGQRKPLVEKSLDEIGQLKNAAISATRGEVPLAAGDQLEASTAAGEGSCRNMTHISVERNRRKQMNEHLAILRSLMPNSYVQRSDQASIIGGVVEFIKELQQLLASLETQKRRRAYVAEALSPRVSIASGGPSPRGAKTVSQLSPRLSAAQELVATSRSPLADVEVKLAGGAHVLLRTLSHKATRGQLVHLIAALECMSLQILHLNITTLQQAVLYTFTLKIGIECRLSVDELADVGQQIFKDIHARRF